MSATKTGLRLAGKVAIVTGGGSGYGEGIARRFASEGAKVLIADVNERGGSSVAKAMPNSMSFFKADVGEQEDWRRLVEAAKSRYGRLDCLVNNAGTTYHNKPTSSVTEADFDKCFRVNVKGVYFGSQVFIPELIKQGEGGTMINVASVGATRPRPGLVWYNASKGAIWNVTKGLAAEYGVNNIRINSVCPLLGGTGLFEAFSGQPDTPLNRANFISNHGIPVPRGKLAQSPTQAAHIVKEFGRGCLIKPQTLTGQRFSFRSAPIAQTAKDAEAVTSTLLGTGQAAKLPSDKAVAVKKVYVTESLPFEDTWYLALTLDREACAPIMIASKNKAASSQEQVTGERREEHVFRFDLTNGITQELTSNVAELVNAPQGGLESIRNILNQLYDLFQTRDATLIEINALAKAKDGTFICLDSNFTADDASEKRQPELFSLRDEGAEVPEEMEARKHGLIYIKLGGNIGNVVNGAGLAMATNDAINYHGGTSANFLDAGGQATKQTMQKAFDIILRDDRVRVILINIYGIIKCDMIAESIIGAAQELGPLRVPLVLDEADLGFFVESDFDKAAEKAVELAKLA
ncbi:hypothetical protein LRP88_11602 [Fusarium phalaenopsidis]